MDEGTGGTLDPRSERVRARLIAAVGELEASGVPFSVSALVRAAGVSRSVFYLHFTDLAGFAMYLQKLHFADISAGATAARNVDPAAAMLQAQRRLVAHIGANRHLYRAALTLATPHGLEDGTAAAIAEAVRVHIAEIGTLPDGLRADLTASYIGHAATGILGDWIMGRLDADEETVAQHLFALLPPWMYAARASVV